jgi:hypothetical protein
MVTAALAEAPRGARRWRKAPVPFALDRGDREREARNDRELLAAGIEPGHHSLYPRSISDVIPSAPAREEGSALTGRSDRVAPPDRAGAG